MIKREMSFLLALWKANLLAAMEYRVPFIFQVLGMILNNGVYFIFWMIFFDRFEQVRGWELRDMFLLFGVVAVSFGAGVYLFGNAVRLADLIAGGRLDYYLALPRPVLLHTLASSSVPSGMGDFIYGILSFIVAGQLTWDAIGRFIVGVAFATTVFLSFFILIHSLAFWMGNASMLAQQATNALITFSLYPLTLFDGTAKFLLFTVIPAAFIGAVPAEFVRAFTWENLLLLVGGALVFFLLALWVFHTGLRRYESGSAIQIQI